jgi:uncharacterized integral membrane protein (TIGR00698 family)
MIRLLHLVQHPSGCQHVSGALATMRHLGTGLALTGALAVGASCLETLEGLLTTHLVLDALVLAILLGVLVRNTCVLPAGISAGATFASKTLLEIAVVVLGASIDIRRIVEPGGWLLVAILTGVAGGLGASFGLSKMLGLNSRLAYLVAVGNAICGNSAIAAVAPVIRAERKDVASAIGLTAVVGVVMVVLLPAAVPLLGLSLYQYGIVAGMAVYAVPQVMAAAFAVSPLSGEVALLVKLVRVMCIGPVVLATGIFMRRRGRETSPMTGTQLLPWFVVGFCALLVLRNLGLLPVRVLPTLHDIGCSLTLWAMAGVGLCVELAAVRAVGLRVGLASALSMGFLVGVSLLLICGLGLHGGDR